MSVPSVRFRLAVAIAVALLAGAYWYYVGAVRPAQSSDFDQMWDAARAFRDGRNPYDAVRAGQPSPVGVYDFNLHFPLPAVVAAVPFSWLGLTAARALYCALAFGVLTYLLSARSWTPLVGLMSGPAFMTLSLAQPSAWLAAAVLVPAFGWAHAVKPNAGLAVLAAARDRRSFVIGAATAAAFGLVTLALWPWWLGAWRDAIRGHPYFWPLALDPLGAPLLLAALRWRDPAARWLLATAIIPGTPIAYFALPLVAFPWSFRTALWLALLSWGAVFAPFLFSPGQTFAAYYAVSKPAILACVYLPALVVVLRRSDAMVGVRGARDFRHRAADREGGPPIPRPSRTPRDDASGAREVG